jgi:hypothetical protein
MLSVTEANTDRDLTLLASVKAEMGITDRASDELIARYITQASDIVAKYCNRVFAIETVTDTFRVRSGAQGLTLSRYPVTEIVSIVEGSTTLTADLYEIDLECGILERLQSDCIIRWPAGKTVVTYKSGFTLPNGLPDGIERATVLLVKQYLNAGDRDPTVRSETVEGAGSTDYFSNAGLDLPTEVEGLLKPHVKPNG